MLFFLAACRHPVPPVQDGPPPVEAPASLAAAVPHPGDPVVSELRSVTTADGVTLQYRRYGAGPPLVVINGGPGNDSRGFEGLAETLGATHTVVLYDQRGTGASPVPVLDAQSISIAAYMSDLEAIRQDLGVEQWHVMGHSFGGVLACQYVVTHADSIGRLLLSSSAGFDLSLFASDHIGPIEAQLTEAERATLHALQDRYRAGDHSDALLREHAEVLASAYLVTDEAIPLIAGRLYRSNPAIGRLLTEDLKRMEFDASAALAAFERPVLILQGAQDIMDPAMAERAHAILPNSELVILDDSGHYGWLDRPERWRTIVETFLRADGEGASPSGP